MQPISEDIFFMRTALDSSDRYKIESTYTRIHIREYVYFYTYTRVSLLIHTLILIYTNR